MTEEKTVLAPSGNGKVQQDDVRTLLGMMHTRRGSDPKSLVAEFLESNKNNPIKARVPNAPGMCVYQQIGMWGSTTNLFNYHVQGKEQSFTRDVEGNHKLFKMLFDENSAALRGKAREEGVTAALGYFLQDIESVQTAKETRLGEKGGASKSK
jgi:hypothetical protein